MRPSMPNTMSAVDEGSPAASPARRFRPRLVPTLATIAVVATCVVAGNWQQDRMHAKESLRRQFDAATTAAPVALASLPAATDWPSLRYRPVSRDRRVPGRPADLHRQQGDGRARGLSRRDAALRSPTVVSCWSIAAGSRRSPPGPCCRRRRRRRARCRCGDGSRFRRRVIWSCKPETTSGSIRQNLDPARFAAATGLAVLPAIIEATVAPVPDDGLLRDWPAPDFGSETHRIYMVQWYAFALLATALWLWFNRPRANRNEDG